MTVDWRKHRDAQDYYDIDFSEAMADDETITTFQVNVLTYAIVAQDKTGEFISADPIIRSQAASVLLDKAADGMQASMDYEVVGRATTSLGRIIVASVILALFDNE